MLRFRHRLPFLTSSSLFSFTVSLPTSAANIVTRSYYSSTKQNITNNISNFSQKQQEQHQEKYQPTNIDEVLSLWETIPTVIAGIGSKNQQSFSSSSLLPPPTIAHQTVNLLWHLSMRRKAPVPKMLPSNNNTSINNNSISSASTVTSMTHQKDNNNTNHGNNSNSLTQSLSRTLRQKAATALSNKNSKQQQQPEDDDINKGSSSSSSSLLQQTPNIIHHHQHTNTDSSTTTTTTTPSSSKQFVNGRSSAPLFSPTTTTTTSNICAALATPENTFRHNVVTSSSSSSTQQKQLQQLQTAVDCYDFLCPFSHTYNTALNNCRVLVSYSIALLEHSLFASSSSSSSSCDLDLPNNNYDKNIRKAIRNLNEAIDHASTLGGAQMTIHWRCLLAVAHVAVGEVEIAQEVLSEASSMMMMFSTTRSSKNDNSDNNDNNTSPKKNTSNKMRMKNDNNKNNNESSLLSQQHQSAEQQFGCDRPDSMERTVEGLPASLLQTLKLEWASELRCSLSPTKVPEAQFIKLEKQIMKHITVFRKTENYLSSKIADQQQQQEQEQQEKEESNLQSSNKTRNPISRNWKHHQINNNKNNTTSSKGSQLQLLLLTPSTIDQLLIHQTMLAALVLQCVALTRAYARSTLFTQNLAPFLVLTHIVSNNNDNNKKQQQQQQQQLSTSVSASNSILYRRLLRVLDYFDKKTEHQIDNSEQQQQQPVTISPPLDGLLVAMRHEALRFLLPVTRLDRGDNNNSNNNTVLQELKHSSISAISNILMFQKQQQQHSSSTASCLRIEVVQQLLTCAYLTLEDEITAKSASSFGSLIQLPTTTAMKSGINNSTSSRALSQYALAFKLAKRYGIPPQCLDRSRLEYCNALCRAGRVEIAARILSQVIKRFNQQQHKKQQQTSSCYHQITRLGDSASASAPLQSCEIYLSCGAFFQSLGNTSSNNQAAELMYKLAISSVKKKQKISKLMLKNQKQQQQQQEPSSMNTNSNYLNHQNNSNSNTISIRTLAKACESFGYLLLLRGHADDAHLSFRKVLSLMLKHPYAFPPGSGITQTRFRYALALESANQPLRAQRVYDQLLSASSSPTTFNLTLGEKLSMTLRSALLHHYSLGQYAEAAALYFVSLALDSENPHNMVQLAWCMLQITDQPDLNYIQKYYEGAMMILHCCDLLQQRQQQQGNNSISLEPILLPTSTNSNSSNNNTPTTMMRVSAAMQCVGPWDTCYVLGECAVFYHDHRGDLQTARQLYERALVSSSSSSSTKSENYAQVAANFAVLLCYDLKEDEAAEKWFEEAVKHAKPHNEAALAHLFSEFLLQNGKISRASEVLGSVARKYGLSDTWHRLAKVEERLHRNNSYDYAVSCYCKALGATDLDCNEQQKNHHDNDEDKKIDQDSSHHESSSSSTTSSSSPPQLHMPSDAGIKRLFENNVTDDMTLPIASDLLLLLHHKYHHQTKINHHTSSNQKNDDENTTNRKSKGNNSKLALVNSLYKILCKKSPNDIFLLVNHARFLNDIAFKPHRALSKFRQALAVDRTSVAVLDNLAEHLTQVHPDRLDLAERCHLECVRENPLDPQAHFAYACFLSYFYPSNELAEVHFHRALELDRTDTSSLCSYAAFLEAMIESNGPSWEARTDATEYVEKMYREAIKLSPHTASHHMQLACFLWRTERLLEAWASFEKCRELDRGNVSALRLYGTFLQDLLVTHFLNNSNAGNNNTGGGGNSNHNPAGMGGDASSKFNKRFGPSSSSSFPSSSSGFGNSGGNNTTGRGHSDFERLASLAESLFKRAFELDPRDVSVLKSYASFLAEIRKDIRTAQELLAAAMKIELETKMAREHVVSAAASNSLMMDGSSNGDDDDDDEDEDDDEDGEEKDSDDEEVEYDDSDDRK